MEFLAHRFSSIVARQVGYLFVARQVGYLFRYKRLCQNLKAKVEDLSAARERLHYMVEAAERKGDKIMDDVQKWMREVVEITQEVNEFLKDEHLAKMDCFYGSCPNLMFRYKLRKKSIKLVKVVDELYEKRDFDSISYPVRPQELYNMSTDDYEEFDSRISTVKKIMDELRNPSTNAIGVYGIGGVGKTTLAKEVCRQVTKENLFDDVVMVFDVRQNPGLDMMQKQIAESLGLDILEETLSRRSHRICNVIKDKKVLIIFDDACASIDLKSVGIPNLATCKIMWTSRSRIVLDFDYMYTQKEFQLHFLGEEESWRLFEKTVGVVIDDPTIRTVAMGVAQKCGGFPILVVTVASLLRNRSTSHSWENSLTQLESFERNRLTERAYWALEWTYEALDDEELKPVFLLCGITARRNCISLEDLLMYSLGLGLFKNVSIEKARNALYSLVEQLKDYCLLLDSNKNGVVRIHGLVRNFAVSIASRDQHILSRAYGDELEEWPNKDFFRKCVMIALPSCNIPRFPKVLEFPEVKLFHLGNSDESLEFSCNFSEVMKELRVLALTNLCIPSLPPYFQFLTNIQMLGLCGCKLEDVALVGQLRNLEILSFANSNVKHLPGEMGQLSRLRLLNLNNCTELEVISPNIISSLQRLEELRVRNSFNKWEAEGVLGGRSNACLSELKHLPKITTLDMHIRDADILPADLFSSKLDRYQILIGDDWKWDDVDESCNRLLKLNLTSSHQLDLGLERLMKKSKSLYLDAFEGFNNIDYQGNSEDFQELKHLHVQKNAEIRYIINEKVVLPNLTSLIVHGCDGLSFLLSSSMARSLVQLKHLRVFECQIMVDIVLTKEYDEENTDDLFPKLEELELNHIPNLTRFCSGRYIELPSLDTLKIVQCTKLEAFIFDSLSNNIAIYEEIEEGGLEENHETGLNYFLFDENVVCPNLTRLIVHGCDSLSFLLSSSMARSLVQLKHLEISECQIMEEVVLTKAYREENTNAMFSRLEELELCYLPNLARFSSRSDIEFPSLERLKIVECTKLETLVFDLLSRLNATYK